MKKIISLALVCVLLVGCVFTLASCGNMLMGSYEAEVEILGQSVSTTYEFSPFGFKQITKTKVLGNIETETEEGSYKIVEDSDGELEITLDFEDEDIDDVTATFEKGEGYIKIGLITYEEVK